jgi:hypothetical protein
MRVWYVCLYVCNVEKKLQGNWHIPYHLVDDDDDDDDDDNDNGALN